jgi:hypothetical protein
MASGRVVVLGWEAGAERVRSICGRLEKRGERDHQRLSPYRELCQVRHAAGHRPWNLVGHRGLGVHVEGIAGVQRGRRPGILSLLLSEVGVAVPEFLAGLFEYRKGTTTTIHIDVGHVEIMFCCRYSNLVGSKTAHC